MDGFFEPANEVVHVSLDEGFLLPERFVREGVAEETAHAAVVGVRSGEDAFDVAP